MVTDTPVAKPPVTALRTYMCLRLGAIGVIAVLAVSLFREYHAAGNCLQGSISAYYYTPVRSVFVGALVTMGLVMIVLWGKTPWEDGALNLAGLVAPVVAFVPTEETTKCGLTTAAGTDVTTDRQEAAIIRAGHDAVINNMAAYLIIVGAVLLMLLAVGLVAHLSTGWEFVTERPVAYWGPWTVAGVVYLLGSITFWPDDRTWFYANAHQWSAITLFAFIVIVVVDIGRQKATGDADTSRRWAWTYWGLAIVMVAGAAVIAAVGPKISDSFGDHQIFFVEAWMIWFLAVFWALQTWDRRHDGAPRPPGPS